MNTLSNIYPFSLVGKVAIVTGGGSGIGRGIAIRMAQAGASVVLAGRRPDVIESVRDEIIALGGNAIAVPTDITKKQDIDNLVQKAIAMYKTIDILVNNAGVGNMTHFASISDSERDVVWNTNMKGTWDCCTAVVPFMVKQNYGRIINISSVTGPMVANKGWTAYAASKGAISGFTRALALDLAEHGVTVNAICPGWISRGTTPATPQAMEKSRNLARSIPLGRVGTPEEVGNLAVFLASEASSYITGTETVIDGGNIIQEKKGDF